MSAPTVKRTYQAWLDMKAEDVPVYPRWEIFANFHADMGDAPEGHRVVMVESDKGFVPTNCIWSQGDLGPTLMLVENGVSMNLAQACRLHEVSPSAVWYRMRTKRCSFGEAVSYCQAQLRGREDAMAALDAAALDLFKR